MDVVLSPYDLLESSPAFAAVASLADQALTLAPVETDLHDDAEAGEAARRLVHQWRWSLPLWSAGLLVNQSEETGTASALQALRAAALSEPCLERLAMICGGDDGGGAIWRDVARGGVSPDLTTSIRSTAHWIGASADLPVVEEGRAKARRAGLAWRVGIAGVIGSPSADLLEWREATAPARAQLSEALRAAIDDAAVVDRDGRGAAPQALVEAAGELEAASRAFIQAEPDWRGQAVMLAVELAFEPVAASFAHGARAAGRLLGKPTAGGAQVPALLNDLSVAVLSVRRLPWAPS